MMGTETYRKFKNPGVSTTLIRLFLVSKNAIWELIDILRFFSSDSKSSVEEPSSTFPSLSVAPCINNIASASEVFPAPWGAISAIFLILSLLYSAIASHLRILYCLMHLHISPDHILIFRRLLTIICKLELI